MKTEKINILEEKELNIKDIKYKMIELKAENGTDEHDFLSENLTEQLKYILTKNEPQDLKVYFDLSYSQGSGFMFETSTIKYKNATFRVAQEGNYYHENNKSITSLSYKNKYCGELCTKKEQEEFNKLYDEFNIFYVGLCQEMAKIGYEYIEETEQENILRQGFEDFKQINNIVQAIKLFDLKYSTKKQRGYIQISNNSDTNFELFIKPFKITYVKERILTSETKINKYYK